MPPARSGGRYSPWPGACSRRSALPKLALAGVIMIALPAVLLGLAPLIASAWYAVLSRKIASSVTGIWPVLLLALALVLSWTGGRTLFRAAERSFWSLNSLAVQPGYALCREGLRHFAERWLPPHAGAESRARLRAAAAAGAGLVLCGIALWVVDLAWPASRWIGEVADFAVPAPAGRSGAGQQRRPGGALPRGDIPRVGDRRRDHGPAAGPRGLRSPPAGSPDVARRPPVRPPRRRRPLRLPHRERALWPARQRDLARRARPARRRSMPDNASTSS